jgi:hypothetical protein
MGLNASVAVQVTFPTNLPDTVPGDGIAASIPFSPPRECLEPSTICGTVCDSLRESGLFSQVVPASGGSGSASTDFVLEVGFGDLTLGMKFMREGVTVDCPVTWRLLLPNTRRAVVDQTIQAHGAGNSLSVKAVSQKALTRAINDAAGKGVSALLQQVDSSRSSGASLALLACMPPATQTTSLILRNLETNRSPMELGMVLRKSGEPGIKSAADSRLLEVLGKSSDLAELVFLAEQTPSASEQHKLAARQQALALMSGWLQATNEPGVPELMLVACAPGLQGGELPAQALKTAEAILAASHEVISEEDYARAFSAPDGSLLRLWVAKSRRQLGLSETSGSYLRVVTQTDIADKEQNSSYLNTQAERQDGMTIIRFTLDSLSYERVEDEGRKTTLETVKRMSPASKQAVVTEVLLVNGTRYRKSSVTSL